MLAAATAASASCAHVVSPRGAHKCSPSSPMTSLSPSPKSTHSSWLAAQVRILTRELALVKDELHQLRSEPRVGACRLREDFEIASTDSLDVAELNFCPEISTSEPNADEETMTHEDLADAFVLQAR